MEMVKMGPIGQEPFNESDWDEKGHNVISHIIVSFDRNGVTSIQFGYVENGAVVMSKTFGSSSAECSRRILRLNHEAEFVTGITGQLSSGYISSLTFHTNQRTHEAFNLTPPSGKFVAAKREFHLGILEGREFGGFFGSYNYSRLTSIGFYARLLLPDVKTTKKEKFKMNSWKKEVIPVGPIGSTCRGHTSWDEKGRNMISHIYVTHGDRHIKSIQYIYFHDEAPAMSAKHGACGGWPHLPERTQFKMIRLNHDEYVTGLSGIDWDESITSLTFYTNKRKHGPICKRFDYPKSCKREINDRREFGGFFGSFSTVRGCLSSIGIYFCPVTSINGTVLSTKYKVTEVTDDDDDQLTLYQSSDSIATINHKQTLEYQRLEFLDGSHANSIGRKTKLKDRIFSKLGRLFRNLLKLE